MALNDEQEWRSVGGKANQGLVPDREKGDKILFFRLDRMS